MPVFTPDDLMDGNLPRGRVVIYDDDHCYMGGVLAELLAQAGCEVMLVTPAAHVSDWTRNTLEQPAIHARLAGLGVGIILNRGVVGIGRDLVDSNCTFTGQTRAMACDAVVLVTSRIETNGVYLDLVARQPDWDDAGPKSIRIIGDANAPGPIAWATYAGHRYARELDGDDIGDALPFRREVTALAAD